MTTVNSKIMDSIEVKNSIDGITEQIKGTSINNEYSSDNQVLNDLKNIRKMRHAFWYTMKGNIERTIVKKNSSTIITSILPGHITKITRCNERSLYFLQFVKILLRYLEMVKPSLYRRAKDVIRGDCISLQFSIRFNLYKLVGKNIWRKIAAYYMELLEKEFKANGKYSSEEEAMDVVHGIVHFTSLAPVHPSKWRGYRGLGKKKKEKRDEEDSYLQDYVMIGRNDVEN
jgi:hypothetical protein